jgi:carbonic anhydrase
MSKLTTSLILTILFSLTMAQITKVDYNDLYHQAPACKMGRLQSPINIMETDAKFNTTINILYDSYSVLKNAQLAFSQRTMFIAYDNTEDNLGYATLSRNGYLKKYALMGIEFSYPGEHQINGIPGDLEVKFVHQQVLFFETSVNQLRKLADANNYLTISILFKTDGKAADNGFISDLIKSTAGQPFDLNIDSYDLFRDRQFFFYEGSFTYSPCDETVNHIVVRDIFTILPDHLSYISNQYKLRFLNDGVTNKKLSDLNGRTVYRNYQIMTDLSGGYFRMSFAILFLILFI